MFWFYELFGGVNIYDEQIEMFSQLRNDQINDKVWGKQLIGKNFRFNLLIKNNK